MVATCVFVAVAIDAGCRLFRTGMAPEVGKVVFEKGQEEFFMIDGEASGSFGFFNVGDSAFQDFEKAQVDRFSSEVFPLDGQRDVRSNSDGSVIGFTSSSPPKKAFDEVGRSMVERGWTAVPSGVEACGSFVKSEGALKWAYVSCSRVGSETSIVVQCALSREEER